MNRTDGLFRLLSSAVRRYSRDPESRAYAARHALSASIALYAQHAPLGDVALIAAEILAELKRQDRVEERAVG